MEFNQATILFLIVIVGQIVGLVIAIRKPNEDQNVAIALLKEQLKGYVENTASLIKAYQNDLHSVQGRVETLDARLNEYNKALSVLATIIEERLPKKNN